MSLDPWVVLLGSVPPSFKEAFKSLRSLCNSINFRSLDPSILHRSRCRCLSATYTEVTLEVLSLFHPLSASPSLSSSLSSKLSLLFPALLRTLEKGERFIQDCCYEQVVGKSWNPLSARRYRDRWLINNALAIALGTEIFDVHLHDFMWCISAFIWVLSDYGDGGLCGWIQIRRVEALLNRIWASADKEGDFERMRTLLLKIGAEGPAQFCNFICDRLSDWASNATTTLTDTDVPTYMWKDQRLLKILNSEVLGSRDSIIICKAKLMGRTFACKKSLSREKKAEVKAEAAVHAKLCHANVIHLVCSAETDDISKNFCLVMEWMDEDLSSLIEKTCKARKSNATESGPFPLLGGLDLMLQIANGMEYLHGMGIIHRDLKSGNILISHGKNEKAGNLIAKVADFGLSKVNLNSSLYTTKGIGTLIWTAPEILDDDDEAKYDKRADVYSFAIVCAEILTGLGPQKLLPFEKRELFLKALKEGRRPKLPSNCPVAISSYIEKCWHGDPSERPTFTQICRALRFFKACIVVGETEMLASPLEDGMLDVGDLAMQRTPGQGPVEGILYNAVMDIPYEARILQSIKEQNVPGSSEGDSLKIYRLKIMDSSAEVIIGEGSSGSASNCAPGDGSAVAVRWHPLYDHAANCFVGVMSKIMRLQIWDSLTEVIGEGSLGSASKYVLNDGFIVSVRWLTNVNVERGHVEQQVATMLQLKHGNLVPLLAHRSYIAKEHVLVSQYLTNGISLSDVLHGGSETVDEETILQVAVDVASGIACLHHHGCTHGHIKSSNILCTGFHDRRVLSNDRWVLTDYGIAALLRDTAANGGYRAPESSISLEADVYSYGMLLLELVTGLSPAQGTEELLRINSLPEQEQVKIVQRRASTVERGVSFVERTGPFDATLMRMLQIASDCLVPNPSQRPTMVQVTTRVIKMSQLA